MLLRINKIFYFRRLQCTNLVTDNNVSISNRGSTRSLTATFILGLDMGWFFWSSGDKNTEPKPPDRQDRRKCWESRDAYFACLDAAGFVKPGDEGKSCSAELKKYEGSCAKSWVCLALILFKRKLLSNECMILFRLTILTRGGCLRNNKKRR